MELLTVPAFLFQCQRRIRVVCSDISAASEVDLSESLGFQFSVQGFQSQNSRFRA